jgi:hypothetical protein
MMKRGVVMIAALVFTIATESRAQTGAASGQGAPGPRSTKIEACANLLPKGSPKIEANYRLDMNPDATVRAATLLEPEKIGGPAYRTAAECIRKALLTGGSLNLPKDTYEQWKTLTVAVDIAPQK